MKVWIPLSILALGVVGLIAMRGAGLDISIGTTSHDGIPAPAADAPNPSATAPRGARPGLSPAGHTAYPGETGHQQVAEHRRATDRVPAEPSAQTAGLTPIKHVGPTPTRPVNPAMAKGFFSKPTGTGVTPLPSQPSPERMAEGAALRAERLKEEGIRSVELTTPGPVITTPGISVGFDLDRSKFENGIASVHNFSGGEFELLVASSNGSVQINGKQVDINTWIPLHEESTEILFGENAKITVRPLALPDDPEAPSGDS